MGYSTRFKNTLAATSLVCLPVLVFAQTSATPASTQAAAAKPSGQGQAQAAARTREEVSRDGSSRRVCSGCRNPAVRWSSDPIALGAPAAPGGQAVTLIASVPLSSGAWQPLAEGEVLTVSAGVASARAMQPMPGTSLDDKPRVPDAPAE